MLSDTARIGSRCAIQLLDIENNQSLFNMVIFILQRCLVAIVLKIIVCCELL